MTGKIVRSHGTTPSGDNSRHRFDIGQAVYLREGFGRNQLSSDMFHITGRLPSEGGLPQYRIRGDKEAYERMVTQDRIEAVGNRTDASNQSLIDKTFG